MKNQVFVWNIFHICKAVTIKKRTTKMTAAARDG